MIYVQDGDLLYEVSGRDLAYFKRLTIQRRREAHRDTVNEQLSGVLKYRREDSVRHLSANIRPQSTNGIARRLERARQVSQSKRCVVSYFFEYLRQQGKAKLARKDKATNRIYSSKGLLNDLLTATIEEEARPREANQQLEPADTLVFKSEGGTKEADI